MTEETGTVLNSSTLWVVFCAYGSSKLSAGIDVYTSKEQADKRAGEGGLHNVVTLEEYILLYAKEREDEVKENIESGFSDYDYDY